MIGAYEKEALRRVLPKNWVYIRPGVAPSFG